jgi:hypothetical protein
MKIDDEKAAQSAIGPFAEESAGADARHER